MPPIDKDALKNMLALVRQLRAILPEASVIVDEASPRPLSPRLRRGFDWLFGPAGGMRLTLGRGGKLAVGGAPPSCAGAPVDALRWKVVGAGPTSRCIAPWRR